MCFRSRWTGPTSFQELGRLLTGCAKLPGLEGLVPVKPDGRAACAHCRGRGTIEVPGQSVELGCYLRGLGWTPESLDELDVESG